LNREFRRRDGSRLLSLEESVLLLLLLSALAEEEVMWLAMGGGDRMDVAAVVRAMDF